MVCKLDKQTFTSKFESHGEPYSYGLMPHLSKKLCKVLLITFYIYNETLVSAVKPRGKHERRKQ